MNQIRQSNIKIYEFPQEKEINAKLPFAVVGSNCVLDINGEKIRGRRYPWGVVNVSIEFCFRFVKLIIPVRISQKNCEI